MSQAGVLNIASENPEIPIIFQCNVGNATAIANVIDVLGSGGVTTTGNSNVIQISVVTTGFTWNSVTSSSPVNPIQILSQNGYSCQGSSLVIFILPLAPNFGDTFIIASTTSRFQIAANGGQKMIVGTATSTSGSGTLTSNSVGDYVEFVYMGSNIFQSFAPQGTLTIT